jgi:hypothetical protein
MTPKTKALLKANHPEAYKEIKRQDKNPKKTRKEYDSFASKMGAKLDNYSKTK